MKVRISLILMAQLMLAACSDDTKELFSDVPIALNAGIMPVDAGTRAIETDEIRGNVPSNEYPLDALLFFTTTSKKYDKSPVPVAPSFLPCRTTISYTSGTKTYPAPLGDNDIKYPLGNDMVYCVGLYPDDVYVNEGDKGWKIEGDATVTASRDLDGVTDILFAPEISGQLYTPFGTQTYSHLQAWVKLNVCAVDPEAVEAWGKIKSIKITGRANIKIALDTEFGNMEELKTAIDVGKIVYSDTKPLDLIEDSDDVYLNTQLVELSSFFYVPVDVTDNVLVIETEKKGTKSVPFDLVDANNNVITHLSGALGKIFVIELHFYPIEIIKAKCTLNQWEDWTDNLYMDKEDI